jgi:hypothetical protein
MRLRCASSQLASRRSASLSTTPARRPVSRLIADWWSVTDTIAIVGTHITLSQWNGTFASDVRVQHLCTDTERPCSTPIVYSGSPLFDYRPIGSSWFYLVSAGKSLYLHISQKF